jgi:RNA polymerase sigma-B factor
MIPEQSLQRLRRRVERARGRIIERAIPLAKRAAKKHRYAVVDLEQEAMIGLIRAVDTFDPDKGASFKTWVDRNVVYAIKDAIREQGHPVHISRAGNAEYLAYRRTHEELTQRYGAPPTDEEVAEEMGVPVERVRKVETYVPAVLDLEEPDESGLTLEERTPAPEDPSEFSDELEALLDSLPQRTAQLLTSESTRAERARALGLTERGVKTELQRERRRLREDPRVLAFKDAVGYETQEDRDRRLARLPQWPAQVPRPAKVRPVRRPPTRLDRYTLTEPERLAVVARCDARYRRVVRLPSMEFDTAEWERGRTQRLRERIARAWADAAYLEHLSRVRRRLTAVKRPVGWDDVVAQEAYARSLAGVPDPYTPPTREQREYAEALAASRRKALRRGEFVPREGEYPKVRVWPAQLGGKVWPYRKWGGGGIFTEEDALPRPARPLGARTPLPKGKPGLIPGCLTLEQEETEYEKRLVQRTDGRWEQLEFPLRVERRFFLRRPERRSRQGAWVQPQLPFPSKNSKRVDAGSERFRKRNRRTLRAEVEALDRYIVKAIRKEFENLRKKSARSVSGGGKCPI